MLLCLHWKAVCLQWKIRRFMAFLDCKIHTRLAIVTANELALAFPPRNLPKKFRPDPSTFYLVIVVTDRQTDSWTDRQTYASDYIIPAKRSFRGDNNATAMITLQWLCEVHKALCPSKVHRPEVLREMPAFAGTDCLATVMATLS